MNLNNLTEKGWIEAHWEGRPKLDFMYNPIDIKLRPIEKLRKDGGAVLSVRGGYNKLEYKKGNYFIREEGGVEKKLNLNLPIETFLNLKRNSLLLVEKKSETETEIEISKFKLIELEDRNPVNQAPNHVKLSKMYGLSSSFRIHDFKLGRNPVLVYSSDTNELIFLNEKSMYKMSWNDQILSLLTVIPVNKLYFKPELPELEIINFVDNENYMKIKVYFTFRISIDVVLHYKGREVLVYKDRELKVSNLDILNYLENFLRNSYKTGLIEIIDEGYKVLTDYLLPNLSISLYLVKRIKRSKDEYVDFRIYNNALCFNYKDYTYRFNVFNKDGLPKIFKNVSIKHIFEITKMKLLERMIYSYLTTNFIEFREKAMMVYLNNI